ncbi:hypothetical protein QR66_19440, partial [Chromobacterium piscinae]
MRAPVLDGRLRLYWPVATRLPSGAPSTRWEGPLSVFARVEYLAARVHTVALVEQTGCQIRATIRRRPQAPLKWRAEVDGRRYRVQTLSPHAMPGFWVLMLEEDHGKSGSGGDARPAAGAAA